VPGAAMLDSHLDPLVIGTGKANEPPAEKLARRSRSVRRQSQSRTLSPAITGMLFPLTMLALVGFTVGFWAAVIYLAFHWW
jgi:hypothetical protein